MAGTCRRCGSPQRKRYCRRCRAVDAVTNDYARSAHQVLTTVGPFGTEWTELEQWRDVFGIPADHAGSAIASSSIDWLRQFVVFAASDGVITDDELQTFQRALSVLNVTPSTAVANLNNQMLRGHALSRIREGHLPRASAGGLHLPTDEHCYLNVSAIRTRYLKTSTRQDPGQLIVTNRKLRFSSPERGGELALSKILSVRLNGPSLSLEATTGALSGDYAVDDAEHALVVIDTTLKIDRRTLLAPSTQGPRRAIPPHIKTEVWQRDHGQCVQCGATDYLEFDHVIPRSRGGADTVANLQILCRRCNLAKSDRI